MNTTTINPNNQQQRVTGFNCPICNVLIPVSAMELLTSQWISCPACNLELIIDKAQSRKALDLLEKVEQSRDKLEQTSNFSL